jgi:hypothetical protein
VTCLDIEDVGWSCKELVSQPTTMIATMMKEGGRRRWRHVLFPNTEASRLSGTCRD